MIVKILGYKISLEFVILMLVIYLVMMIHAIASCCNGKAIAEGFAAPNTGSKTNSSDLIKKVKNAEEKARIAGEELLRAKLKADEDAMKQSYEKIRREKMRIEEAELLRRNKLGNYTKLK
jgi:flagellar motor protein MotB